MAKDTGRKLISSCKKLLAEHGYSIKGAVASRIRGAIAHAIAVRSSLYGSGEFYVLLEITLLDPFKSSPEYCVCLRGYVAPGGAGFRQHWWKLEDIELAKEALASYADDWLTENGSESALIQAFGRGIADKAEIASSRYESDSANEVINELVKAFVNPAPSGQIPFPYHRFLSLLYFHRGEHAIAKYHAAEYLKYVAFRSDSDPSGATYRLLQHLRSEKG